MYIAISDTQVLTLIPACQRGDTGAIEGLYDLYADRIYHYVLARTGDVSAAEDLTADVFLRVIQHVHRFKLETAHPAASVSAWLYRIAANLVADYHRARQRRLTVSIEEDAPLISTAPDPSQQAERRDALDKLSGALEKLTEDQRLVVVCKFGESMSNAQAAAWLGKTEGAIEALQHRALRTLCRLLGAKQGGDER
jgi:RNA polymerase sigma-70 factor (ECF subfamily)